MGLFKWPDHELFHIHLFVSFTCAPSIFIIIRRSRKYFLSVMSRVQGIGLFTNQLRTDWFVPSNARKGRNAEFFQHHCVILLHYPEHRLSPDIFQWEIDFMGSRIGGNDMCVVVEEAFPDFFHTTRQVENGNDTLFACHIRRCSPGSKDRTSGSCPISKEAATFIVLMFKASSLLLS